jgi:hypothetical protein
MDPTPDRAVNEAMAAGQISKTLPFIRRESVRLLTASYPSEGAALEAIASGLQAFYRTSYQASYEAWRQQVDQAVRATSAIYRRNVFPDMNVKFGTYPSNLGHTDSPGCFRCHDDEHSTKDGKTIGQDCEGCHREVE